MKYQLPEVEELKEIGFKFKYNTMQKSKDYMKDFVKNNRSEVVDVILPEFDVLDFEEQIEETDLLTHPVTSEIIQRMIRLKNGFIEKNDYYFKIHPKYRHDRDVLFNFWKNQYIKFCIDSQLVMYDQALLKISEDEAIDLVFYNELLRFIIRKLPNSEFKIEDDPFEDINSEIGDLVWKIRSFIPRRDNRMSIRYGCYENSLQRCYDQKYEDMFSLNQTVEQKAVRIYYKLLNCKHPSDLFECTSIPEKESVLRYFLRKQSDKIIESKNTRGKGVNKAKAKKSLNT